MKKLVVRRKLLAGSLSAPLVLTVSSVGAATTSFDRAFKANPGTQSAPALTTATNYMWADSWYRIVLKGTRYYKNNCNASNLDYVYVIYPSQYGGDGKYYLLQPTQPTCGSVYSVTGGPYNSLPGAPSGYNRTDNAWQVAALAFFDPTTSTNPTFIAWSSSLGNTVANKSVYASVIP